MSLYNLDTDPDERKPSIAILSLIYDHSINYAFQQLAEQRRGKEGLGVAGDDRSGFCSTG